MPQLRKGGHRDLERFYPLLEADFDSEELFSKATLHRGMLNGSLEFLIMTDEETGMDLAYAVTVPRSVYGYVLLKYFGVMPWYRGKGVGVDAMRLLNRRYAEKQGIVAEITDFPDEDPDHQKKLMRFFRRFGYTEIDCDYRISGVKAHLFCKPVKGTGEIGPVADRILLDFYTRILRPEQMRRMLTFRKTANETEK